MAWIFRVYVGEEQARVGVVLRRRGGGGGVLQGLRCEDCGPIWMFPGNCTRERGEAGWAVCTLTLTSGGSSLDDWQGLCHISEMDVKRVSKAEEVSGAEKSEYHLGSCGGHLDYQ